MRYRPLCSITTTTAVAAGGIPWLPVLPSPGRRNCCAGAQQHEGNPKYRCVAQPPAQHRGSLLLVGGFEDTVAPVTRSFVFIRINSFPQAKVPTAGLWGVWVWRSEAACQAIPGGAGEARLGCR